MCHFFLCTFNPIFFLVNESNLSFNHLDLYNQYTVKKLNRDNKEKKKKRRDHLEMNDL